MPVTQSYPLIFELFVPSGVAAVPFACQRPYVNIAGLSFDSESTAACTRRLWVVQTMDITVGLDWATGWSVLVSNTGKGKRFSCKMSDRLWGPPNLLFKGCWVLWRVKRPEREGNLSTTSSAEVANKWSYTSDVSSRHWEGKYHICVRYRVRIPRAVTVVMAHKNCDN